MSVNGKLPDSILITKGAKGFLKSNTLFVIIGQIIKEMNEMEGI